MEPNFINAFENTTDTISEFFEYTQDLAQRTTLFTDILRKQGNVFLEHNEKGMPPVLKFEYEIIMDGRKFEKPVNYALAKIIPDKGIKIDETARPIIIIDPRAGHGPGIGGFKEDSKIGVALRNKNPVYFVVFFPLPEKGQTLSDVEKAEIKFIQEVGKLHPKADKPAIVGNCQAGWAIALMAADEPNIAGPIMLNGSPLSYWAGKDGSNPMRYRGGLFGGIWLSSLAADMGNQHFDGANLVKGFEDLNPSNTYWKKPYHVFANVDTEEERFLEFERWWNGFYFMNKEEIKSITENLFVGNKLESGQFEFEKGRKIDLKKLKEPVILFCSEGDNITPPTQALNWVIKVWGSEDEIKRHQQVIIYLVHENIGHLGIFVSGKVANKEHKQIIGNVDLVELLSPGLYEMVIDKECELKDVNKKTFCSEFNVKFEERTFDDILNFDDGLEDEKDFEIVDKISVFNDNFYEIFMSPFVRAFSNEASAAFLRTIHPLRKYRYFFSDLNPALIAVKTVSPVIKNNRKPASKENRFLQMEKVYSDFMATSLDYYRDTTDSFSEFMFKTIYGNPLLNSIFGDKAEDPDKEKKEKRRTSALKRKDSKKWLERMKDGGIIEGAARIMIAMAKVDNNIDHKELKTMEEIILNHVKIAKKESKTDLKEILKEQSRILQIDEDAALSALPEMIKTKKDRETAIKIAYKIAKADNIVVEQEEELIKKFEKLLT